MRCPQSVRPLPLQVTSICGTDTVRVKETCGLRHESHSPHPAFHKGEVGPASLQAGWEAWVGLSGNGALERVSGSHL